MDILAVLQDPEFTKKVFFPRPMPIPQEEDPRRKILQLDIGDNVSIGGLFFQKAADLPTLLFFHGNGEIAEDYAFFADQFLDSDVNCAFVDYRGYGFSTGSPNLKNLIEDAMKIYTALSTWLATQNLSPKIFVHGRSLGSICAAEIGAKNPETLRGLIIDCGFCDTYNQLKELSGNQTLPFTAEEFAPFSNMTRFNQVKKSVLIIHGNQDFIVNVAESQKTYDALPTTVEKTKVIIEGAGHNDILMYDDLYFTPIKDFIAKNRLEPSVMSHSDIPIILDTDISLGEFGKDVDDGLAIVMALNSPELNIVGITKTYGNTSLSKVHTCLDNILKIWIKSKHQHLKFPRLNGADRPIHRLNQGLRDFLYKSFMRSDNLQIDLPTTLTSKLQKIKRGEIFPAVRFFADYTKEHPKDVTIVCIGPLTNLALSFLLFPDLKDNIRYLSLMGGAIKRQFGYEFNFANDPLATNVILAQPIRKQIASLEVCQAQQFTIKEYQRLSMYHTRLGHYLQQQLHSWIILNRLAHGASFHSGFYPFDPCAIVNLIDPTIIQYASLQVRHSLPKWIWDFRNPTLRTYCCPNRINNSTSKSEWGIKIHSERFMDLLVSRLH